ncbi:MAG TPA: hypothetical protein VFF69_01320 [Phycisphaerales bacterium]|nr:hypothetical protein [Phycisphaerales bacterium]
MSREQALVHAVGWLLGPAWIRRMRRRHRLGRRPLTEAELERLGRYFSPELLARVRVVEVRRIELWGSGRVRSIAARRGGRVATRPAGLTLDDLVLVIDNAADRGSLLFHELVHVAQFARLGRRGFAARYLTEWWNAGRDVGRIDMERDAYELQARFEHGEAFSVEAEVARRLGGRGG